MEILSNVSQRESIASDLGFSGPSKPSSRPMSASKKAIVLNMNGSISKGLSLTQSLGSDGSAQGSFARQISASVRENITDSMNLDTPLAQLSMFSITRMDQITPTEILDKIYQNDANHILDSDSGDDNAEDFVITRGELIPDDLDTAHTPENQTDFLKEDGNKPKKHKRKPKSSASKRRISKDTMPGSRRNSKQIVKATANNPKANHTLSKSTGTSVLEMTRDLSEESRRKSQSAPLRGSKSAHVSFESLSEDSIKTKPLSVRSLNSRPSSVHKIPPATDEVPVVHRIPSAVGIKQQSNSGLELSQDRSVILFVIP